MKYIYFDESVHDRGGFIVGVFTCLDKNPDNDIADILRRNSFTPEIEEFKSSTKFTSSPNMIAVRSELKEYLLHNKCQFSLLVLPRNNRKELGGEAIKALRDLISTNNINDDLKVSFDQGIFNNAADGLKVFSQYDFLNCEFHPEMDSIKDRGIQLADLIAHTCSIMLLDQMGLVKKKIKAGGKPGYDPQTDIELGFEMWASIRYSIFSRPKEKATPFYYIEPFGLYVSSLCGEVLAKDVRNRFGEFYLGCIH